MRNSIIHYHPLYFICLRGATAGLMAWAISAWVTHYFPGLNYNIFGVELDTKLVDPALIGLFTGGLSYFFMQYTQLKLREYNEPIVIIWTMWIITGLLLGFAIGSSKYGIRTINLVGRSIIGGGIGGVIGAGLFICLNNLLSGWASALPYALGMVAIGTFISWGAEKAIELVTKAKLRYIPSEEGLDNTFSGSPVRELFQKQELLIGNNSEREGNRNFFHVPDEKIKPCHVYLREEKGIFKVIRHHENVDPDGNPLRVLFQNGGAFKKVLNEQTLVDNDILKIGKSEFIISYPHP